MFNSEAAIGRRVSSKLCEHTARVCSTVPFDCTAKQHVLWPVADFFSVYIIPSLNVECSISLSHPLGWLCFHPHTWWMWLTLGIFALGVSVCGRSVTMPPSTPSNAHTNRYSQRHASGCGLLECCVRAGCMWCLHMERGDGLAWWNVMNEFSMCSAHRSQRTPAWNRE